MSFIILALAILTIGIVGFVAGVLTNLKPLKWSSCLVAFVLKQAGIDMQPVSAKILQQTLIKGSCSLKKLVLTISDSSLNNLYQMISGEGIISSLNRYFVCN